MNFPLIPLRHQLSGYNTAFVPNAAFAGIRALAILGSTDDHNEVVIADAMLHELCQLVTRSHIPLVEVDVDAIVAKAPSELPDPSAMLSTIP